MGKRSNCALFFPKKARPPASICPSASLLLLLFSALEFSPLFTLGDRRFARLSAIMPLNPLAPVTDYQSMLNRIFWFTTAAALVVGVVAAPLRAGTRSATQQN